MGAKKKQVAFAAPIKRWQILKDVIEGRLSLKEASALMGVSYRQAIRLKNAMLTSGVRGLIHGNTGKKPSNLISDSIKDTILQLSQKESYRSMNDTHFCEHLRVREGIVVSREIVRQVRRNAGIVPVHQKRSAPVKISRNPHEGETILWYSIHHEWFSGSPPSCCLITAIDHDTGKCLAARFFQNESSAAYLWILREIIGRYGVPSTIIQDCNSFLKRVDKHWSIQEQLSGEQYPTQVGAALKRLGINTVYADTKRKKRLLKRVFEEFYVCLIEEIEKEEINSIPQANSFLDAQYITLFNSLYAINSTAIKKAWKPLCDGDVQRICSLRYEAEVDKNHMLSLGDISIAVPRGWGNILGRNNPLEVRQLLDGSWRVYFQDTVVTEHPPTPVFEPQRTTCHHKKRRGVVEEQVQYVYTDVT